MRRICVYRCNVHGVSSKKIKHMLENYEHNVTAQTLFAMLTPLVSGRLQVPCAAAVSTSDDLPQDLCKSSVADHPRCIRTLPSATGFDLASGHSCAVQLTSVSTVPASVALHVGDSVSADVGIYSCSSVESSSLVSETVRSSAAANVPAVTSGDQLIPPTSSFTNDSSPGDYETVGKEGNAARSAVTCRTASVLSVPAASLLHSQDPVLSVEYSVSSSDLILSNDDTVITSPLPADVDTTDVDGTIENLAAASGVQVASSQTICAETVQTSEKQLASKLPELIADGTSHHEAVFVGTEPIQSRSEYPDTDATSRSSADLQFESFSGVVTADFPLESSQAHAVDTLPTADVVRISSGPADRGNTQLSDAVKSNRVLLTSSLTEVGDCSSAAETGTASDDEAACRLHTNLLADLTETCCDAESACSRFETLDGGLPTAGKMCLGMECSKHLTPDNTVKLSPNPDPVVMASDEKCFEVTLHRDTAQAANENDEENETHGTDRKTEEDRMAELSCKNEKSLDAVDEQLLLEITANGAEGNIGIQSDTLSLESDDVTVNEVQAKHLETQCYTAPKAAELIYWGQTDTDKRLLGQNTETEVRSEVADVAAFDPLTIDSEAAEQCIAGVESKPRRTRIRGSRKKQISSLLESVLTGKEWVGECEHDWNPATKSLENDAVIVEPSHTDIDKHCIEQRDDSTQTDPSDFIVLTKVTNGDEVTPTADYVAVVSTLPRVISSHVTDSQTDPTVPFRLLLHKSCSTADESESVEISSRLSFLASCFPAISSQDLQELLANCGNDITVVADLLSEFGYEYNEPQDDVTDIPSSSTSCTDSSSCSPVHSVMEEKSSSSTRETRNKKNTSALYRLYEDSLVPKSIVRESRKMQLGSEVQVPINSLSSLYHSVVFQFMYFLHFTV